MVMDAISHSLGDILVILDNNPDYTQHRHQSCNEDLWRLCKGWKFYNRGGGGWLLDTGSMILGLLLE